MLEVTRCKVSNIKEAIRGMRNPLRSWDKSDTHGDIIGPADMALAQKLIAAGPEHAKFLRQIGVIANTRAPRYWWTEMDQYKVGTVTDSESTMHTITARAFLASDFAFDAVPTEQVTEIVESLNRARDAYFSTRDQKDWRRLIQILPQSYMQMRTWSANYAVLRNIYRQRAGHKLTEWAAFRSWIESLPYAAKLLTDETEAAGE